MKSRSPLLVAFCLALVCSAPLTAAEKIILVAGGGANTNEHVLATEARLNAPFGVAFDKDGNLIFVEMTGNRVRQIDPQGFLTTIAGSGEKGGHGDGVPATKARFNGPHGLAIAPGGDIYIADTWNNCVRKIDRTDNVTLTLAGTGQKGRGGDEVQASKTSLGGIYSVALDATGQKLYLADLDNRRVRVVDLKIGLLTTVAGNGTNGVPTDGAVAKDSPLVDPRAVAVDGKGNVYILERNGHALRMVDRNGLIRTVAGTGQKGSSGDDGNARQTMFSGPKHLCLDRDGNVIIADTDNHAIRKYLPREGKIVRVAGTGKAGSNGVGGPPLDAELNQPHGVYVHTDGTLYIADSHNNRILKIVH